MIGLKKELESTTDTDKLEELSEKVEDALDSADMIIEKRLHDYGIFELKIIKYKEKADEEELNASKENMADDIKTGYQEMIALREELAKGPNGEKLEELSEKTKDVLESVDTIIEKRLNI